MYYPITNNIVVFYLKKTSLGLNSEDLSPTTFGG